jgi:hypothetical protein
VRARSRTALAAAIAAAVLALPAGASAAQAHYFAGQAIGEGAGAGAGHLLLRASGFGPEHENGGINFHELAAAGSGVAVDSESHDVYVADTENHRVSEFEADGTFVRAFGWGVLDGTATAQVCTTITTCQEGIAGSGPGQLSEPLFIAVDNDPSSASHDDVYVGDTADDVVTKFSSEGAFVSTNNGEGSGEGAFSALDGLAVDTAGNLAVFDQHGAVYRFDPSGAFIAPKFPSGGAKPGGLAIDGPGNSYLIEGFGTVEKLGPTGTKIGRVLNSPSGGEAAPVSVAADQLKNDLYVDQEGAQIADVPPSCEPAAGLCSPIQIFGEGKLEEAAGLAVDPTDGTVYAANAGRNQILAFPVAIEANSEPATEVKATTATLQATVNPEGSNVEECTFEYGTTTEYGRFAPCEGGVGSGNSAVPTEAKITGLTGGTPYHYRVFAKNAHGQVRSEDRTFTTEAAPTIDEATATGVTASSATLTAKINPHGVGAGYRFEYGTSTAYGTATPKISIGGGSSAVPVSQAIGGLGPDTTYHFRVVVEDAEGDTTTGEDHTFVFLTGPQLEAGCDETLRPGASAHLSDCRGYEMVTPPQKNGALIGATFPIFVYPQISADGSRVTVASIQCFGAAKSCVADREAPGQVFEFSRASGGWETNPLAPSASLLETSSWVSYGGSAGIYLLRGPDGPNTPDTFYLRRPDGTLQKVGLYSESLLGSTLNSSPTLVSDGNPTTIVFETTSPIWSFDGGESNAISLYQYTGASEGAPRLVGVSGGVGSTDLISACGTERTTTQAPAAGFGSLSADGRLVYFTARQCSGGTGTNAGHAVPAAELYERVDDARTIEISAGTAGTCESDACEHATPRDAAFEGASDDGDKVFFTSTQQLTDGASQDQNGGDHATLAGCVLTSPSASGCNLYLSECADHCEIPSQRELIDVSAGAQAGGPKVQGVVAISPDGNRVYFVAKGVLGSAGENAGEHALSGANNLYVYERDEAQPDGALSFIATLSPNDARDWRGGAFNSQGIGLANVTPDGRFLVFTSHRGLTPDASEGEGPTQVYRYDAVTKAMMRISIGQKGFNDNGNAASAIANASIVESRHAYELGAGPARANPTMSGDGRYVFFQSPVALASGALSEVPTGGTVGEGGSAHPELAQNVYEWETQGAGDCSEPQGCVSLISDGTDVSESGKISITSPELLGTDETGEDVFFATNSQLTAKDTDTQRDYYDARVGGGEAAPVAPTACEGDACKGQGTSAAAGAAAATPNVNAPAEGPNNRRGGAKCAKKKSKSKSGSGCQKKPKHPKKKHHKKQKAGHGKKDGHGHKKSKGKKHHPGGKGG